MTTSRMIEDDPTLLRRYAATRSEPAFAALVERYLDLVYSAALRRLGGDAHHAADVAQTVFLALARHAAPLSRRPVLIGWLYTTTRHAAIDLIRTEQRRRTREHHAHVMEITDTPDAPSADWEKLRPLLDSAVDQLAEREREIILLRFFENRSFADLGARLSLTDDAARMRAARALEKLRALLARRGVTSTAAALGTALTSQTIVAAPNGLALTVTTGVLAGITLTGTATITALSLTLMTAATKTLLTAAAIAVVTLGTAVFHQTRQADAAQLALAAAQRDHTALRAENTTLNSRLAEASAALARLSALQQATEAKAATVSAASSTPARPPVNLRWTNPEYARTSVAIDRASLAQRFGLLYRELNLSAEQIAKFENAQTELRQGIIDIWVEAEARGLDGTPVARLTSEPFRVLETSLRALLGDAGFEQYKHYEKGKSARDLVNSLAGGIYFSETPLTTEQGSQLTQILRANTETKNIQMNDDGKVPMYTLREGTNWTAVNTQAQTVLSASQLAAFNMLGETKRLETQLRYMSTPPGK